MTTESGLAHRVAVPLHPRCKCNRPRRSPTSLEVTFWRDLEIAIRAAPEGLFSPSDVAFRHYCRHCDTETIISVGDLGILDAAS